jgi:hypothetical protein
MGHRRLEPFGFDQIEAGLWIPDFTRFPDANRCPRRSKTLWTNEPALLAPIQVRAGAVFIPA